MRGVNKSGIFYIIFYIKSGIFYILHYIFNIRFSIKGFGKLNNIKTSISSPPYNEGSL